LIFGSIIESYSVFQIPQAFDEIHRLVFAIAFFGLLLTLILFIFDKSRSDTLNGPRQDFDDISSHSSDIYHTNIDPKLNTSMSDAGNSSFFRVY
jgi:hypothetical protein